MHKRKNRFSRYRSTSKHLLVICLVLLGVSVFLGCGDTYETAPAEEPLFLPSDIFADTCADLSKAHFKSISSQGIYADENNWLRSWSHETYLWYDEIIDQDPSCCSTPVYFDLMKTFETNASGAPKDRFHFTVPTAEFLANRQSIDIGYGAEFALLRAAPPRDVRIAYTEPDSPATAPGVDLSRGAQILEVDGEKMLDSDNLDVLNNGLFPRTVGESHTFTVLDLGSQTPRTVTMTSVAITSNPVQNVKILSTPSGDRVGYMLFNAHNAPAAQAIVEAGKHLKNAGIDDLIVDLRYNSGGLVYVAQILSSMVAGADKEGLTFEEFETNGKVPSESWEFTFEFAADDIIGDTGLTVPSLGLPRLFVLTSPRTCSASESVINSLLGIDIDVIRIGSATCGKPHGFLPTENCGTVYHSINFRGVNAKGEADFEDGFTPHCRVAEDFNHLLGDPEEILLKTALAYRASGACPPAEEEDSRAIGPSAESPSGEAISRPPGFSGKIAGSGISPSN
ncbi:MAG: peptidase [Candidatus Dadabacteria bacterium]|nr:peptidase [Candidatus Dadabacteria bacterium]MYA48216.1 peptidase [Candidatus Dadabacteria bacterium]MYG83203.1 peptidase [Candidatus Dadabacteria bacterium]MYK48674.1 peptidase [Candidatus Dadabacteria bacterium]